MYREDFIDNYTVHEKGTMMEMQLTKAEKEGNQDFIKTVIKELLWYDIYVQFVESNKVFTQCNSTQTNVSNNIGEIKSVHVQATVKTKTKENQTSSEKIIPKHIKHQSNQTIECALDTQEKHSSSILNLFKKTT
jgi:hypothetical protein